MMTKPRTVAIAAAIWPAGAASTRIAAVPMIPAPTLASGSAEQHTRQGEVTGPHPRHIV
jgi:hypothetical protein